MGWEKSYLDPHHQRILKISYNGEQYVGMGLYSKISISTDAMKWEQVRVSQKSNNTLYDATWG